MLENIHLEDENVINITMDLKAQVMRMEVDRNGSGLCILAQVSGVMEAWILLPQRQSYISTKLI
jgi:hypothetical protein